MGMWKLALLWSVVLTSSYRELERAVLRDDGPGIEKLVGEFRSALDRGEADPTIRYAFAYGSYRLAILRGRGSREYESLLKDAETVLEALNETDPENAEALALHATVNGCLITGVFSALRRGPRAASLYDRALEQEPSNPRVWMLRGVSRIFRPPSFGGGPDRALSELERALALFREEPEDKPWPNGGRAEVHAWLGQVLLEKGFRARAREHYERALLLEPEYRWVKDELLPQLDSGERAAP